MLTTYNTPETDWEPDPDLLYDIMRGTCWNREIEAARAATPYDRAQSFGDQQPS